MKSDANASEGAPGQAGRDNAAWSNRDHAAQPAHRLGPKAQVVHTRRVQRVAADKSPINRQAGIRLSSGDASVSFVLRALDGDLIVERTQRRPLGTHLIQAMLFGTAGDFQRWCDAEPARFEEPLLHQLLQRHGEEHFRGRN